MDDSVIDGNRTLLDGAGIYNAASGTVTISDSTISNHDTLIEFATVQTGAGIYNAGDVEIVNSTIEGNVARRGGAIYNVGALEIRESTLRNNHAAERDGDLVDADGGALYDAGTNTTISSSVFSDNSATNGGAILNWGNQSLILDTATVANNAAVRGGGLYNRDTASTTIISSTVAHNIGTSEGGGVWAGGTITVGNSILAENTSPSGPDYRKSIASHVLNSMGSNLVGASTDNDFLIVGDASDLIDVDAMIGPLGDYGGPTETVGLRPGSPAINSAAMTGSDTDQRGEPRL